MATVLKLLRRLGIGVVCLVVVGFIIRSSLDPDQYFRYENDATTPFEYPTGAVAVVVAITLVEGVILSALLRPWRPAWSWRRPLLALLLFGPWLFACMSVVMHAPGFLMLHHIWVLSVVVTLVLALLGSVAWAALHAHRERRGDPSVRAAG